MFFLRKEWQDPEDGIEAVILHWTSTPPEQEPNWKRTCHTTMMILQPATSPVLRRCALWVTPPFSRRRLLRMEPEGQAGGFLLHSFFEVIQRGRTWSTETVSQEIRAVMVTHSDPSTECAQADLYYSLDALAHVNCVPMLLEGLPAKYQFLSPLPEGGLTDADSRARARRYDLIAQLPSPHLFRGQIWGPVGTRALYAVYCSRQGAYNPFSEGGFWLLHDGNPWEVRL